MPWVERETRSAASCLPAHGSALYQLVHSQQAGTLLRGTASAAQGVIHHARTLNPHSAKPLRRAISSCGTWLYVEGVGRPRPDLPPAQRRLMARRAAEVDAMRNLALAHRTRRTPPFRVVLTDHAPDGSVRVVLQSRAPLR